MTKHVDTMLESFHEVKNNRKKTFQSKYIAVTISLLVLFGGMPLVASAQSPVFTGSQISTHGPFVSTVDFTNIGSDSTLYSSLAAGTIQVAEWTFTTGSYLTSASNPSLTHNSTLTYFSNGIAFNMLHFVINDTHFRQAIQDLTSYTDIESTVLSGIAGVAAPAFLPCSLYPTGCNPSAYSSVSSTANFQAAAQELLDAGLVCNGCTAATANSSTTWTYGPLYGSKAGTTFSPLFYYRVDDPLRTGAAALLVTNANKIGLVINARGITDAAAGGTITGASGGAIIAPGTYDPATGGNTPASFNYTYANSASDAWDMYTYGWILGPPLEYVSEFFNNAIAPTLDFINWVNSTMNVDTNSVWYASTLSAASTAAQRVDVVLAQQIPYLVWFYESNLWAVYTNGWAGYVNFAGFGPGQSTGIYYTLLNLHQTGSNPFGGTITYATHAAPDNTGLDPLYNTLWLYQEDLWDEIYDTLVLQSPIKETTQLAYNPWMGNYSVTSYTGSPGAGAGYFDFQPSLASTRIVDGQMIVFHLYDNMTFSDNTKVTAYDFNATLWYDNVAGVFPANTPFSYTASGPSGLIESYISPSNPYQITFYYNSSAVWNFLNLITPVMPAHILDYFNASTISLYPGTALDTTKTFAAAATECGCLATGVTTSNAPLWLKDELNLEVGSGPFYLSAFNPTTGSGAFQRNINYYRSAWYADPVSATQGTSPSFSTNIAENFYNSGTVSLGGVAAGTSGIYPITNATGTVTLLQNGAQVGSAIPLTGGTGGTYSASIPTASLSPGLYEVEVNATYNFLGLARTWFQFEGLQVTAPPVTTTTAPPVTTTTAPPTTTTSTTSSTDYTPYILGGVVVVIIVIIAIALATRRRGTGGGT